MISYHLLYLFQIDAIQIDLSNNLLIKTVIILLWILLNGQTLLQRLHIWSNYLAILTNNRLNMLLCLDRIFDKCTFACSVEINLSDEWTSLPVLPVLLLLLVEELTLICNLRR